MSCPVGEKGEQEGIIPRICHQLFSEASTSMSHVVACKYEVSYVEIYMERVKDLLDQKSEGGGGFLRTLLVILLSL